MSKNKHILLNGLIDLKLMSFLHQPKESLILGLQYLKKEFSISTENGWMDGKQEEEGIKVMTI